MNVLDAIKSSQPLKRPTHGEWLSYVPTSDEKPQLVFMLTETHEFFEVTKADVLSEDWIIKPNLKELSWEQIEKAINEHGALEYQGHCVLDRLKEELGFDE